MARLSLEEAVSNSQLKIIGKGTRKGRNNESYWLCQCSCGTVKEIRRSALTGGQKSCGCLKKSAFFADGNGNWKGGRTKTKTGYITITPKPYSTMLEHRYIMENHLGRQLLREESVHHVNGVRDDNRIENLELWSKFQPYGQRVSDKIAYAEEILRQYKPQKGIW